MKKYISLFLCLIMIISLLSCNAENTNDADVSDNNATDTNTPTPPDDNTESKTAMEMYEAAINGEICVFDEHLGKIKLKNLEFSSNGTRLDESKLLMKAILDIDQDGVSEYVIKSPDDDYIILHCYNGKVYSYSLDIGDYCNFNTDGTFYWCSSSEEVEIECGLSKIIFDRETVNIKSIYSFKYSEKYEYYVEGKSVTVDEYCDYRYRNIRYYRMKFSQFDLTCSYPITAEQAWNLANAYWDNQDGCEDGAAGTIFTSRIVLIDTPNSDTNYYRVAFQVEWFSTGGREGYECMPPYDVELKDQILVNAFTGEITASTYEPGGDGVSIEEAIEIVKNDCEYIDIDFDNEENGYRVEHAPDSPAPDHIYVIVIIQCDTDRCVIYDVRWVDKNTGELIERYYV